MNANDPRLKIFAREIDQARALLYGAQYHARLADLKRAAEKFEEAKGFMRSANKILKGMTE